MWMSYCRDTSNFCCYRAGDYTQKQVVMSRDLSQATNADLCSHIIIISNTLVIILLNFEPIMVKILAPSGRPGHDRSFSILFTIFRMAGSKHY